MLQPKALPHSVFRDAHKGVVFVIRLKTLDKAFKATLEVNGLDPVTYEDKSWADRDQLIIDISADAYGIIEKMNH